jgi:hypothetical protein
MEIRWSSSPAKIHTSMISYCVVLSLLRHKNVSRTAASAEAFSLIGKLQSMRTATNHLVRNNGCPRCCMAGKDYVRVLPQISGHVKDGNYYRVTVVTHMLRPALLYGIRRCLSIRYGSKTTFTIWRNSESGVDIGVAAASSELHSRNSSFSEGSLEPESEAWL